MLDPRIPSIYSASVTLLRNNGDTVVFWVDPGVDAQKRAALLRDKGYSVNSVIRFKTARSAVQTATK